MQLGKSLKQIILAQSPMDLRIDKLCIVMKQNIKIIFFTGSLEKLFDFKFQTAIRGLGQQ